MKSMRRMYTSDLAQLTGMRSFVREACELSWGTTSCDETINLLILAFQEAATNVILHAYDGKEEQPIEVVVDVDDLQASISIYHEGRDFDPEGVQSPAFDGSRETGFGIYLIRQSMDEVEYFRGEQGRKGIRLVKKRESFLKGADVMQPEVEMVGDVAIVRVNLDQLDASNADDFRRDMTPILQDAKKLVLDMSGVQFVDSRGCGAILSCLKSLSAAGGDLKLCEVVRPVRMVFELIRLHRICEILNTKENAVTAFQNPVAQAK